MATNRETSEVAFKTAVRPVTTPEVAVVAFKEEVLQTSKVQGECKQTCQVVMLEVEVMEVCSKVEVTTQVDSSK